MGYGDLFSVGEDDPISSASAQAEQPRLYLAPEVINQELCRMLSARTAPAPAAEPIRMKLVQQGPSTPAREFEWPIR